MSDVSTNPVGGAAFREVARRAFGGDLPGDVRRVFAERRADLRIAFGPGADPVVVETHAGGVAVESRAGVALRRSLDFGSDVVAGDPVVDAARGLAWVAEVAAAAARMPGPAVRGAYVASDQRVAVAAEGRDPVTDRRTGERIRIEAEVRRGNATGRATADHVALPGRRFDPETAVADVVRRATARLLATVLAPGRHVAVLAPGVGGILVHELVGHALEGDAATVISTLARERPRFRDETVRIVDDPRRGRVPWTVDDEGEPSRAVGLVDRGRVTGLVLDRRRAEAAGLPPSGHGRAASYLDDVRPRMGCTFLAAGPHDPAEVLEATASGVYVRRISAASVDAAAGVATARVDDADRIEGGRLAGPIAPFAVAVGLDDLLRGLDLVASDLAFDTVVASCVKGGQPLAVSVGAPTIRLPLSKVSA